MSGVIERIARWIQERRGLATSLAVLVTLVAAFFGLPPRIDPNILALLPTSEPMVQTFMQVGETGGVNMVLASVSGSEDALDVGADQLALALTADPTIDLALAGLPDDLEQHLRLMQLEPQAIRELTQRLDGALALGPAANPLVLGPLLELSSLSERIAGGNTEAWLPTSEGEVRILIRPVANNLDPEGSIAAAQAIERILATAPSLDLTVESLNGPHIAAAQGLEDAKRDFGWISLVSAVFVLLVLSVGLGSLRAAVVVFPPIVIACIVELALFTNLVGPLNNYTTFGTAILLGLGIDIAVHLVASVREQLATAELDTAVQRAWRVTGPACVTGALTSAAGFLTLTISSFRGFSQLGVHLALGLVLCLVAMFVLLPLLLPYAGLTAREAPTPRKAAPAVSGVLRGALAVLLIGTVGVGAYAATHLSVEYDFTAVAREGRVFSRMDAADQARMRETYPPIVVPVRDGEPVHVAAERIRQATASIDAVSRVMSSNDLVPTDQDVRIDALTALQDRLSNPNARYLPVGLVQQLATLRTWDGEPRTRDDIPAGLYTLFGGDEFVLIRATGDLYDVRNSGALAEQLHTFAPRASSELLLQARLYELIFDDLPWIAVLALLAVLILVFVDMRRLRWTFAIGLSLVMGLAWASAAVAFADIRLNVANLVALPVLLGIGVDAVVHLAHRLRADPQTWRATRTIAVAIALSTVTTLVSFSSLTIANSGGIRSFGRMVFVGLTMVVLVSCTALALFHAVWGASSPAEVSEEPAS